MVFVTVTTCLTVTLFLIGSHHLFLWSVPPTNSSRASIATNPELEPHRYMLFSGIARPRLLVWTLPLNRRYNQYSQSIAESVYNSYRFIFLNKFRLLIFFFFLWKVCWICFLYWLLNIFLTWSLISILINQTKIF